MARVHFVKKARKANRTYGIKKGDSYYWWANRVGRSSRRHVSKSRPTRSQTTMSGYYSIAWGIEDGLLDETAECRGGKVSIADLCSDCQFHAEEVRALGEECEDKRFNMEDKFPNGCPTMETLEARKDACETIADALESAAGDMEDLESKIGTLKKRLVELTTKGKPKKVKTPLTKTPPPVEVYTEQDVRDEAADLVGGVSWDWE
jgi:hypothetical protein